MNDTTRLDVHPEIGAFVARVRARLADLTEEEREELVGGLEGDLSALVADGGDLRSLDPAAYAAELRSAAGLEDRRGRTRALQAPRRPAGERVTELLDTAASRWQELVTSRREATVGWELAVLLRPAWWALRAWVAVELIDLATGPLEYLTPLPSLGNQVVGAVLLLAAVAASALLGQHQVRRAVAQERTLAERLALLAVNAGAVIGVLVVGSAFPDAWTSHAIRNGAAYAEAAPEHSPGLMSDGHFVRNVFPYDAAGRPLTGVQLYDAKGRPLAVTGRAELGSYLGSGGARKTTYPWFNGDQPLFNVYPLPVREQGFRFRGRDLSPARRPPVLPASPLAVVPPAALPSGQPAPSPGPSSGPSSGPSAGASATPTPEAHRTSRATPTGRPAASPRVTDSEKAAPR